MKGTNLESEREKNDESTLRCPRGPNIKSTIQFTRYKANIEKLTKML